LNDPFNLNNDKCNKTNNFTLTNIDKMSFYNKVDNINKSISFIISPKASNNGKNQSNKGFSNIKSPSSKSALMKGTSLN
jgi:hypothetical protein